MRCSASVLFWISAGQIRTSTDCVEKVPDEQKAQRFEDDFLESWFCRQSLFDSLYGSTGSEPLRGFAQAALSTLRDYRSSRTIRFDQQELQETFVLLPGAVPYPTLSQRIHIHIYYCATQGRTHQTDNCNQERHCHMLSC
eukprot:Protomagalhaensia_wolfi_Nauph_80__2786@NODE_2900_length_953_cov_7_400438_g2274_i0_p1_GENE_NODE_2900_length_953_cov_7_400438_g2274_i0NODE_2900_length_953_cov_7_400438_g2274_i0_p1_ORF_typecomplete_len140_score10_65_NODE_2900_length_953_cov_7_400438_g2274_i0305724